VCRPGRGRRPTRRGSARARQTARGNRRGDRPPRESRSCPGHRIRGRRRVLEGIVWVSGLAGNTVVRPNGDFSGPSLAGGSNSISRRGRR
jgi:hypothetical protein